MYVVTVVFRVHPEHAEAFLPAIQENARLSLEREPGCQRFDVCVGEGGATTVFLYEIYSDRAAFEAHVDMDHFRSFDAQVSSWVADKQVATYVLT